MSVPRVWLEATVDETAFLARCIMLAPTLDLCERLLRGERVPRERLDQEWLRRYGL